MGFEFPGHVLRAPQVAPSNSATSSEPTNGVVRDVRVPPERSSAVPAASGMPGNNGAVDLMGDYYQTAILQAPGTSPTEYLVWAANSSQLALVDTNAWWTDQGTARIPVGENVVGAYTDGALHVIVTDDGGRDIGTITHLVIARGDKTYDDDGWVDADLPSLGRKGSSPYEVVVPTSVDQTGIVGLVRLTDLNVFTAFDSGLVAGTLASVLDGGVSVKRGDAVVGVRFTVSPVKFWWTRNDRYETRFGWDGKQQRWKPFRGGAPTDLGALAFDTSYTLVPKPRVVPIGSYLSGDASTPDSFSTIRVGSSPSAASTPVGRKDPDGFEGIRVLADADVATFEFSDSALSGVIGQTSAVLRFNPSYVEKHAGGHLWYSYGSFVADSTGVVGDLLGADRSPLFLSPIPGPTEHPFIRLGNRTPLSVSLVDTEADIVSAGEPLSGQCLIALSTGRLRLSLSDIRKSDPQQTEAFDKHYLGAQVVYDGVALNLIAQPTRAPVPLVQSDGVTTTLAQHEVMYLPPASMWPEDLEGTSLESYMGLGTSGVLYLPDGTGAIPNPEGVIPSLSIPVRPGGDSLPASQVLGLVRAIHDGVGDTILFSKEGAITEVVVKDRISDLPSFPFQVPGGRAFISKEATILPGGREASSVQISSAERSAWAGKQVFFLQASLTPATFTTDARIFSRNRLVFRFEGDEVLYFAIDGIAHDWHASSLPAQDSYTAEEVAASIQAQIDAQLGSGICRAFADRILLQSANLSTGRVEIGWGAVRDLSGAAALGFLPGWHVVGGKPNWLVDSGISLGLSRSLINLDRSAADADYKARTRLEDVVLSESIVANPFQFLDFPPVEDVAGFDEGVFFNLQSVSAQGEDQTIVDKRLEHFVDIQHRFPEGKFAWLDQTVSSNPVTQKTTALALGQSGVVPESMLGAPGINGGLFVAEDGGRFITQQQGVDYLLPNDGLPGVAQLVTRYGARVLTGALGTFTQGTVTFSDASANFLSDSTDPELDANGEQVVDNGGDLVWLPLVREGFRLKLSSGSYLVTSVLDGTHLEVWPPFIASTERPESWEIFSGIPDSLYDPAIVADVVYEDFNHLPEEPFRVQVLSPLGVIAAGADFTAFVEDANASGRNVSLRFGPVHDLGATLTALARTSLGTVGNGTLVCPWTSHVSEGAFTIVVGVESFTPVPVASFSVDPQGVEYLTEASEGHSQGELKFAESILSDLESSPVTLMESLRESSVIPAGTAEYDPKTGAVRISDADRITNLGATLYFTEQMITRGVARDVAVSPMIGSVSFNKPLRAGSLVEMTYWLATSEGRRVGGVSDTITEFLPVFVRREESVRLTNRDFELDPEGLQVWDTRVEPIVFVGPTQQNFGKTDFTTSRPGDRKGAVLSFDRDLPSWVTPVASYAVFNAQGGERAYTTSQSPVYRPPFFIQAGKDNFGLRGNRTGDFTPGQMLRIGADCFYITQVRYFSPSDVTRVDIYPPTVVEVGTRSPGNDVLSLITSVPVTPVLLPDDDSPIATTAASGFMQQIPTDVFPFEPVNARQATITFRGNLTSFAVPGHVMEIAGMPFTIAQAELNEDGTRTSITFTSAFQRGVDPHGNPTIRLSYRPIYPPEARTFVGVGPLVSTEDIELTLFGEVQDGVEQPGRQLVAGSEFNLDSETGVIQLLDPMQAPLGPQQKLLLSFTKVRSLEPFFINGGVALPRWAASFRYNATPSAENGVLGGRLTATYTFDNPDSFYFRVLPLRSYLPEALKQALDEMKQGQASSGPRFTNPAGDKNWDHGNMGLASMRRDLLDKDRAARAFLGFYNDTILAFEQVVETITGEFVGDRDGKFRFWVGRGKDFAPPGYEDPFTGVLNPANVWVGVFNEQDPTQDITFLAGVDPLVVPDLCTMSDLELTGEPFSTSTLARLINRQKALVRNDIDDIVLIRPTKPKIIPKSSFPYFTVRVGGRFGRMGGLHRFSRLFPTSARVFFTLQPGIGSDVTNGDPGVFSWRRVNAATGEAESTYNEQVGQVSNPVLGDISDISEKILRPRTARARVWGYFPNGLPASAFGTAVERPCMVVSAVPLASLPIDPATGYPDTSRLLSQSPSGDTADAVAGDPEMALPGFVSGDKVGLGKPDGRLLEAVYPEELGVFGLKTYTGVFIDEILFGCVFTFKNRNGGGITSPGELMVATEQNSGLPAHLFGLGRADTIYVVPADTEQPIDDPETQSPTVAMMQTAAAMSPSYRQGFDLSVKTDGQVMDLSLPSWKDPFLFPLKEMQGQRSPVPLGHVEGAVEYANTSVVPLNTPALQGQAKDDSGDFQIPYKKGTATELDRFDEIHGLLGGIMARDVALGGYYPDEILFVDGEVASSATSLGGGYFKEPATLMTQADVQPSPTWGVTEGRPGDFLIMEVTGSPQGWQGLLSVGALRSASVLGARWSWVEPPRFVTQTNKGSALRYSLQNYAVYTTPGNYPLDPQVTNPPGVRLFDDITGNKTIISFQDVVLGLNDGSVVASGNLNTILAADPNNVLRIKVIGRPDDTYVNAPAGAVSVADSKDGRVLLTIQITSTTIECIDFQGNTTGPVAHTGVSIGDFDAVTGEVAPVAVADYRHIIVDGVSGVLPFTPTAGTAAEWFLPNLNVVTFKSSLYGWEFALDVDTTGGGSTSAFIGDDRLTFHEALDLETLSRPRGFTHSNGVGADYVYETGLRVTEVTLGTAALSTINDVAGAHLSFLSRTGSLDFAGGTWTPAASPSEDGTLRVMAFESGAATPITAIGITASVQASQSMCPTGVILNGTGLAGRNWFTDLSVSPVLVEKGDTVYVDTANPILPDLGTEKAGTYVVRHAVTPDVMSSYKAVTVSAPLGSGGGFVTTPFPRCLSLDVVGGRLEVDDNAMLPAAGWVYILVNRAGLNNTDVAIFRRSLFRAGYLGFDLSGPNPQLVLTGSYFWADNTAVAAPTTDLPSVTGLKASWTDVMGRTTLGINVQGGVLPEDSVVGYHDSPAVATYGFNALTFENFGAASVTVPDITTAAPGPGGIQVLEAAVFASEAFDPTGTAVVYEQVPGTLVVRLSTAQGDAINNPQGHPSGGVNCLLPGTAIRTEDAVQTPGFYALGGVFIEPSVPQQPLTLAGDPKVVDQAHSLLSSQVGMRSSGTTEDVHLEVRRVRRWHGKQVGLNDAFLPLRYAYEVRRGVITGFSRNARQVGVVTALLGTNLGMFDDEDVNIHPGDIFRVLDAGGAILDEGVVAEVLGSTQLKVAPPGLSEIALADFVGKAFEIYLRQAPVPHEQSNEQLLDLITDKVVHQTQADRTDVNPLNWTGGYVPETDGTQAWLDVANVLYDDTGVDFTVLGVQKGDIVVIDPAGSFPVIDESGFRPLGDRSVPSRTADGGPSPYQAGAVSSLDDNRGFYRVTKVFTDHLEVNPVHTFAGTLGSDVIQGATRTNLSFTVYPTVSESVLSTDSAEGQNDLRPTRKAVGGSYTDNGNPVNDKHSIRPFSYKVIRATGMFSAALVDTVLMMRERMLSLIEMLGTVTNGARGGFYYDWQEANHIEDLGAPTDPESGLGLFPNRLITGLLGETSVSPFANNSACLSLLDRRFWVHDSKLDTLEPDPTNPYAMRAVSGMVPFDQVGGPYTAYTDTTVGGSEVRPVLTDHLDLILNVRDRLRSIRYTWLTYRTHRLQGTLARIERFDAELPVKLAERQRLLLLETTANKVGS